MKGIELSRKYWETYGLPMMRKQFPQLLELSAVGLVGNGSECFGYDDIISRDHDYEPGFCIFLPEESTGKRDLFDLERAYASLPDEFEGMKRSGSVPPGGRRNGVIIIEDFLEAKTGSRHLPQCDFDWFSVPENGLCELENGEIFYDGPGIFTDIREKMAHYPEDVMLKKLAGRLFLMGQSGPYNYTRCLSHGEKAAAELALSEFVNHTLECAALLCGIYLPYYKWSFRALRECPPFGTDIAELLEKLLCGNRENEDTTLDIIDEITVRVINKMTEEKLVKADSLRLEYQAFAVNDRIGNAEIRNENILFAV